MILVLAIYYSLNLCIKTNRMLLRNVFFMADLSGDMYLDEKHYRNKRSSTPRICREKQRE